MASKDDVVFLDDKSVYLEDLTGEYVHLKYNQSLSDQVKNLRPSTLQIRGSPLSVRSLTLPYLILCSRTHTTIFLTSGKAVFLDL